jgi:hypothetical protein
MFRSVDDEVYRHGWEGKYRLEKVTELPGTFRVPVPSQTTYGRADLPQAAIVVGERGSGMTTFIEWLTERGSQPAWELHGIREARLSLEPWQSSAARASRFVVVDRSWGAQGDEDDVAWLAGLIDSASWRASHSRLVCVTRDVRTLRTDPLFSTILSRGHAFRLPHFDPPELKGWVRALLGADADKLQDEQIEGLGRAAKGWVGGQPFLTHLFFSKVKSDLTACPDQALHDAFDRAGAFLRDRRPHMVLRWQEQLASLIGEPTARQELISYASGKTKTPGESNFTDHDVDFFLAGWVGRTADGERWGIRSRCHEHWARQAIRGASESPT